MVQHLGGCVAVAAVVGYAFAYQLHDTFYESFGLTPEQVGVDRVGALLRMTPAMFVIGVSAFVLAFVFVGTMAVLRSMVAQAVSWQVSARTYAVWAGVLLFAALMVAEWSRHQDGLGSIFPESATFQSSMAMGMLLIGLYLLVRWFTRRWAPLVVALAAIAVLGYQMSEAMSFGAWQLQRTGESSVALWLVGISPHYASVRWGGSSAQAAVGDRVCAIEP